MSIAKSTTGQAANSCITHSSQKSIASFYRGTLQRFTDTAAKGAIDCCGDNNRVTPPAIDELAGAGQITLYVLLAG
ncbi:hypothetical protein G8764_00620 [Pseudomaricurvus alcaniphilus]|uniref:hypothetical protein n=1 Tax=Pseudomaricurvus alcaniphilus TaxID=1166482 RepID=UPI00140B01BF|nr:hypothetical protein [Pseudomaricurvus alcaniphilus]NHN35793.1 hypothetical protein [Pseudomaricurvus alcaniphilus]